MHFRFNIIVLLTIVCCFILPPMVTAHVCDQVPRQLQLSDPKTYGYDVVSLQKQLISLGYNPGNIDGYYGEETATAVAQLQKDNNLEVTGSVTDLEWTLLAEQTALYPVAEELSEPDGPVSIVINTVEKKLTLYSGKDVHATFPVAVGKQKTPSPIGEWKVVNKGVWGGGFGTRWMGLNVPWGIYGIHGTNKPHSIGSNASAGCIRMNNRDVEKLFPLVPVGTPVNIIGEPVYPPNVKPTKHLKPGSSGRTVVQMQKGLKDAGILMGRADGRYGTATETFVKRFQVFTGLDIDGEFKEEDFAELEKLVTALNK
ncbi:lipoprotein-anchoring transpeptidase ErfK/SrfK [Desulfitispora alkaliphila]|uniref:L,D-transpeptidase family protein n=1 Tax=Desulfitispora alkaliphila TaxID=622674 RepID=UPI003D24AD7C